MLLDEIEKAHPDVYNILLQVLDEGRLTDGKGRIVDFTNTIIIGTSNLGSEIIQRNLGAKKGDQKSYDEQKLELMQLLRLHFKPEFLNRIDEIIIFHALSQEEIKLITKLQLERVKKTARGQGITLIFDESLINHLSEVGFVPEFGARELKRRIQSEVETKLAKEMLEGSVSEGDQIKILYTSKDGVKIEKIRANKKEDHEPAKASGGTKRSH